MVRTVITPQQQDISIHVPKNYVGKKLVILPVDEFNNLLEELEDQDDVRLYDEAKKEDTGERIPMEEAFRMIEAQRKNK